MAWGKIRDERVESKKDINAPKRRDGDQERIKPKRQEDDTSADKPPKIVRVALAEITEPKNHRAVDEAGVHNLAHSFGIVGQLYPVSLIRLKVKLKSGNTKLVTRLIDGLHRKRAAELKEWTHLDGVYIEGGKEYVRLREIAENLFRTDLSYLERSEQIWEWAQRTHQDQVEEEGAQNGHPGGKQPHDQGISRAARELDLSRTDIQRAKKVALIEDGAKALLRSSKKVITQDALLRISEKKPEEQIDAAQKLISAERPRVSHKAKPLPTKGNQEAIYAELKEGWGKAKRFQKVWALATKELKQRFIKQVLLTSAAPEGDGQ